MMFTMEVKSGLTTIATITGREDVEVTRKELEKVIETENFLEKLLGFRVHINIGTTQRRIRSILNEY